MLTVSVSPAILSVFSVTLFSVATVPQPIRANESANAAADARYLNFFIIFTVPFLKFIAL